MRLFAAFLLASVPVPLAAQSPTSQPAAPAAAAPFVQAEAREVVTKLATALEENFVFPDKGKAYATALRAKLAAGGYNSFADGPAFAKALTADLQAVHKDGHLRVGAPKIGANGAPGRRREIDPTGAIGKSGWIAPGVAYIDFTLFPGDEATLAKLDAFLAQHSAAKTLIIDARAHRGGGLAEMNRMFPLFYGKPAVLVQMDTRAAVDQAGGDPFEGDPSVRKIAGPDGVVRREHLVTPAAKATGLRSATIYLLTSARTASAAEHLALSLKRTGRATLVGEPTAGAGHYGGVVPLAHGYAAFIPVGRTFDPDTGEGWEGVGVKPDVAVPADQALDRALALTGVKADASAALGGLR